MPREDVLLRMRADVRDIRAKMASIKTKMASTSTSVRGSTSKMGGAFGNLKTMIGGAFAAAALYKFQDALREIIGTAVEFEGKMREINTLAKLNEKQFGELSQSVLDMAERLGKDPAQMAESLYQIQSAGYEGAEAMEVLEQSVILATAGLADQGSTADAVTTALNAWGMSARDADDVASIFFKTVEEGKIRVEEMAQGIGYVASIASTAGVPLEELAATIATMTKAGVKGNKAFRGMRQLISKIAAPSGEAADKFEEMGIGLRTLQTEGIIGVLRRMKEETGGNLRELKDLIPNIRALAPAASLSGDMMKEYERILRETSDTTVAHKKAFEEMGKSMTRQIEEMKSAWTAFKADFGEEGFGPLRTSINAITDFVKFLRDNIDGIKKFATWSVRIVTPWVMLIKPMQRAREAIKRFIGMQTQASKEMAEATRRGETWWIVQNKVNKGTQDLADSTNQAANQIGKLASEVPKLNAGFLQMNTKIKTGIKRFVDTNTGARKLADGLANKLYVSMQVSESEAIKLAGALKQSISNAGRLFGQIISGGMEATDILSNLASIALQLASSWLLGPLSGQFVSGAIGGVLGAPSPGLIQQGNYTQKNVTTGQTKQQGETLSKPLYGRRYIQEMNAQVGNISAVSTWNYSQWL